MPRPRSNLYQQPCRCRFAFCCLFLVFGFEFSDIGARPDKRSQNTAEPRAAAFFPAALSSARPKPERELIFSHRKHLSRRGTKCEDCHGSVHTSTTAQDNNLPREKTCLVCHDGRRARKECSVCHQNPKKPSAFLLLSRSFRFNHQLHLGFGNIAPSLASAIDTGRYLANPGDMRRFLNTDNACIACHRGVLETDLATEAHLPRMADCLICHTKIDPPFSCVYCHTEKATLKPASHSGNFAERHSSRRDMPDKSSCKVCHGIKFTCMGCH